MRRSLRLAARISPALLAVGLLSFALRSADLGRALSLVHSLGWLLPLLLLPNLVAMAAEAGGLWLALAARLPPPPRFAALLSVRLTSEALMLGLPSGSFVNESMQPYLLKSRCGMALERGIVAAVARKFLVVVSHGLFLALATLLTWRALDGASRGAIGRGGLPWLLLAAASVLLFVGIGGALATAHGRVAERLRRAIDRLGGRWLGHWLERNAARFQRTDAALSSFFGVSSRRALAWPLLLFLLGWLVRSLETLVFLRLLGVVVRLDTAMVIETSLILLRAMAVPVPGGLGVQDLGYVLLLKALGLPDATTLGAAFVLMKRGKDLFWVLTGFLVLALGRPRAHVAEPGSVPQPPKADVLGGLSSTP